MRESTMPCDLPEREPLPRHSNAAVIDFILKESDKSLVDRFEHIVNLYPEYVAIQYEGESLTYQVLNRRANQLAQCIQSLEGARTESISLLFEHGISAVVAIWGVLKAGKKFVFLDPSMPRARLNRILAHSQAKVIVTDNNNLSLASELELLTLKVVNIDTIDHRLSEQNIGLSLSHDHPSCILYTSGSTGEPKGILSNHRSILHRAWFFAHYCCIGPDDNLAQLHAFGSGASMCDIFGSLLNGATLYPYNIRRDGIASLSRQLVRDKVTVLRSPVALFRLLMDTLSRNDLFPDLRLIALGGDAIFKNDVERFRKQFSATCLLGHQLACTEAGMIAFHIIHRESDLVDTIVPVGYPIGDKEVLILDKAGRQVASGQAGEIAVKSCFNSPGYWLDPYLTAKKFLSDPQNRNYSIYLTGDLGRMQPSGRLEHLGRSDLLVKIRGHRVELTEVEAALYGLEGVKAAAVVANQSETGNNYLVAYVVPINQPEHSTGTLRAALLESLPDFMIPSFFVALDQLPLNINGKLDRDALPTPGRLRPHQEVAYRAPCSVLESKIVTLWEDTLGVEGIGMDDNFFELGGDSIAMVRLLNELSRHYQMDIKLAEFLGQPTIAGIVLRFGTDGDMESEAFRYLLDHLEQIPDEELQSVIEELGTLSPAHVRDSLEEKVFTEDVFMRKATDQR